MATIDCTKCFNSTEPVVVELVGGPAKMLAREACERCDGTGKLHQCSARVAEDCGGFVPESELDDESRCGCCAWLIDQRTKELRASDELGMVG